MPRLSDDQWADARARWEAEPTMTFDAVGAIFGVSKQAVTKAAKREGWERTPSLHSVNEAAQFRADGREIQKVVGQKGGQVVLTTQKKQAAEEVRAVVIERHRADWMQHRELFTLPEIKVDFNEGKAAKITAEMLTIRQKGERAAYGMDTADNVVSAAAGMSADQLMSNLEMVRAAISAQRAANG